MRKITKLAIEIAGFVLAVIFLFIVLLFGAIGIAQLIVNIAGGTV